MKKAVLFYVLFLFMSVPCLPETLFGESRDVQPDQTVTLQEIVVTATRDREDIRQVPANVSVITSKQIEQSGATSIIEVLDKLESIQFRDYSGNATQAVIDMRGFGGDNPQGKTVIMIDGRRINSSDMSSINWLQIPLSNIEKIEVVRGASSVLYGDAAIGGVINIITKKGKGPPQFNASIMAGSYGIHNERASITGALDRWSYALTGENRFIFGYRERSKSVSQGGGFDLGYDASEYIRVSLGASFNRNAYDFPGALTKDQMAKDRRQYQPGNPYDDATDRHTNVNLRMESVLGAFGRLDVGFMYGNKDAKTNMDSWWVWTNNSTDTFAVTPKYILEKDILGHDNKVILGLDYYYEPYRKDFFSSRDRTTKTSWADLTRDSLGFYVRDEFSLLKSLILTAGYRSERTTLEGSNTDVWTPANNFSNQDKSYNAEAYEAGLTWLIGRKSKIYAKIASVYRIPFLDEVASFNGSSGGFLKTLEKEKGISTEAGTQFYPLDNLKIGLTLFRIDMEDEIQYVGVFPTGYNQNTGKTRHDGAEFSLNWLWEKMARLYGNVTYHMATFENGAFNRKEMPLVPNWMSNAGVEIYLPYDLMLRPEMRYVDQAYLSGDNDNNAEKLDAYTLFSLYLFYKPTSGKVNFSAFFGVENLTDVKYSSSGLDYAQYGMANAYYPMPGVTWKGGISFAF